MRARISTVIGWGAVLLVTVACEVGGSQPFSIIPGPSVPSPPATYPPYAWDTREELDIWVNNRVTHGPVPISLVDQGQDAFIRIEPKLRLDGWVLRGPDLTPPARNIRGLRLWYRWRLDPSLSPTAARTFTMSVTFEAINSPYPPSQPSAYAQLQPAPEWTEANVPVRSFLDPLEVKYVYFHQFSSNPGVFEIDRIELVE
jgi:hypothetical protein